MKRLTVMLPCLAVLTLAVAAQTPPATADGTLLEIHRFVWDGAGGLAGEPPAPTEAAASYRTKHSKGYGDYYTVVAMKNVAGKAVTSVNVDMVFRDSATQAEFLTYRLRFEGKIKPGQKKELHHRIARDEGPDNFVPAGRGREMLGRTGTCDRGPLPQTTEGGKRTRIPPCYYLPIVTRIEYADGTSWQP